jgi:gamma-glutamylcyclotransferase (GGCT)/AIG2-like uncharacterized protein YtfP
MSSPPLAEPTHLFVYGTLMRGHSAHGLMTPGLRDLGPAQAAGTLYDLGPWPGFRPGAGIAEGELYAIDDPLALARLDDWEGIDPGAPEAGDYVRVAVDLLEPPLRAWAYVFRGELGAAPIVRGRWRDPAACRDATTE